MLFQKNVLKQGTTIVTVLRVLLSDTCLGLEVEESCQLPAGNWFSVC